MLTLPENRSLFHITVSRRGFQLFPQPVESSPPGSQGELVTGVGWMSSHPSPCCQQHSEEQTGPGALISKDSPELTRGVGIPLPAPARHFPFSHILTAQQVGRAGASPRLHIPTPSSCRGVVTSAELI